MTKKQGELEGFKVPSIKQIDRAAKDYYDLKALRATAQTKEVSSRETLMGVFGKHGMELPEDDDGIRHYKYQDGELVFIVAYGAKEAVNVKRERPEKPGLEVG